MTHAHRARETLTLLCVAGLLACACDQTHEVYPATLAARIPSNEGAHGAANAPDPKTVLVHAEVDTDHGPSVPKPPLHGAQPASSASCSATANPPESTEQSLGSTPHKADRELLQATKTGLLCSTLIDSREVRPRIKAGVVALEGSAPTLAMRRAAEQVTRQVPGVVRVDNRLAVESGNVRDSVIQARLQRALDHVVLVPDRSLRIDVHEGVVRLTGTLSSATESADVEAVAHTIQGVRAVHNEINVINPAELRRNAAKTNARPRSDQINVR